MCVSRHIRSKLRGTGMQDRNVEQESCSHFAGEMADVNRAWTSRFYGRNAPRPSGFVFRDRTGQHLHIEYLVLKGREHSHDDEHFERSGNTTMTLSPARTSSSTGTSADTTSLSLYFRRAFLSGQRERMAVHFKYRCRAELCIL